MDQITIYDLIESKKIHTKDNFNSWDIGTYQVAKGKDFIKYQNEILKEINKIGAEILTIMRNCKFHEPGFFNGRRVEQNSQKGPYICFGYNKIKPKGIVDKVETIILFEVKGPNLGNLRAAAIRKIEEWSGKKFFGVEVNDAEN